MSTTDAPAEPPRRRQARADATRLSLLEAAIHEFAAHGFEGASTRAIATRAGTHQPQINYHFDSKEALWRAAIDHLFAKLGHLLGDALPPDPTGVSAVTREDFAAGLRAFVRAVARLPELNRIMVQEATADSDRLAWIVERHIRPFFDVVTGSWRQLRSAGTVAPIDETVLYYSVIGAASLLYVNAAEARRLLGFDPIDDAFVEAHADALVTMFLGRPGPEATL